jgi:hypothetical protein
MVGLNWCGLLLFVGLVIVTVGCAMVWPTALKHTKNSHARLVPRFNPRRLGFIRNVFIFCFLL